jgi:hypothetical protein
MQDHLLTAVAYAGRFGFAKSRAETCATEIKSMIDYARKTPGDAEWAFERIERACDRLAEVDAASLEAVTMRSPPAPILTWTDHDRNVPEDERETNKDRT